jgi:hypothetical protein
VAQSHAETDGVARVSDLFLLSCDRARRARRAFAANVADSNV